MYLILTRRSQCLSKRGHEHVLVNPPSNVPIQYQFVSISHIVLFCALFVDNRSDSVSSGRSASFRLLVSELACSVSTNSYSFSFFSQFWHEITCICIYRVIMLHFPLDIYIHTYKRHGMELGKLVQARHNCPQRSLWIWNTICTVQLVIEWQLRMIERKKLYCHCTKAGSNWTAPFLRWHFIEVNSVRTAKERHRRIGHDKVSCMRHPQYSQHSEKENANK